MGLNTKNAGGLTNRNVNSDNGKTTVKLIESVYVESLERDGEAGEIIAISNRDARSLVGMKFAEYAKPEARQPQQSQQSQQEK